MSEKLEPIEGEYLDKIFNALQNMHVFLDESPLTRGPAVMNAKHAKIRGHLSDIERIITNIAQYQSRYKKRHRRKSTELELCLADALANNASVRAERSSTERQAKATILYKDLVEDVRSLELSLEQLDSLLLILKSKKADLKDTQSRLRDQYNLCLTEIKLGDRWGDGDLTRNAGESLLKSGIDYTDSDTVRDFDDLLISFKSGSPQELEDSSDIEEIDDFISSLSETPPLNGISKNSTSQVKEDLPELDDLLESF